MKILIKFFAEYYFSIFFIYIFDFLNNYINICEMNVINEY